MDATNWGDVPTWVASVVAITSAVWAMLSRRAAAKSQEAAAESARTAAAAAADSAESLRRMAAAAERYEPRWSLGRVGRHGYELRNETAEDAAGVALRFPDGMRTGGDPLPAVVGAGGTVRFMALRETAAGGGDWVEVTWHRRNGDEHQWSSALPAS